MKSEQDFQDEASLITEKKVFLGQIKTDLSSINNDDEKKKLIDKLAEQPELLQNFSTEKINILIDYCVEEFNKKFEILKNMNVKK